MHVPFKRILFRIHWICGITAGLVLAVVGATGAILAFEEELLKVFNPAMHVAAQNGATPKAPDALIAAASRAFPDSTPRGFTWTGDDEPALVRMAKPRERGVQVAVDPYTGVVLGVPRGSAFFEVSEQLHRNLAAGPVGKQIVGASTVMLLVMALSGIYLRWVRRPRGVADWFRFDFKLRGRALIWRLHAVAGTWLLVFYLLAALTGLWWSYDWYRAAVNSMAGVATPARRPPQTDSPAPALPIDRLWTAFRSEVPDATRATIALSSKADAPVEIRYLTPQSSHERALDTLKFDASTGEIAAREPYSELPRGRRFVAAMFPLHSGSFFGLPGRVLVAFAALLMPLFAVTGIWIWMLRRRSEAARNARFQPAARSSASGPRSLVEAAASELRGR